MIVLLMVKKTVNKGKSVMNKGFNFSGEKASERSDIQVFAASTKVFLVNLITRIRHSLLPKVTNLFYKLSILREIEDDTSIVEDNDSAHVLRLVSASNHAKQVALLDMAVFTSPEFQDCLIEQRTLKEMVIEFQIVKSKLFVENRSANGTFIYEGSLVEQIMKNFEEVTPILRKIYIDFFKEEVYQYHCSSVLDLSTEELFDEKWLDKVSEKLANFNSEEIISAAYPREVLNKFKFMYMLVKIQEIKYDSIAKARSEA